MAWVNLNDVYVNKTGGTITGDLAVNGNLVINDGKGADTTYNVANEITTLRDSVSHEIIDGWNVFKFNNNFAYATQTTSSSVKISAQYGNLYYLTSSFTCPDIFSSVISANVNALTGSGLWWATLHETNNYPNFKFYYISNIAMTSTVNVQKEIFGLLK